MDRKIGLGIAFSVALGIAAPALAQQAVMWGQNDFGQVDAPDIGFRQINTQASFSVGIDLQGNLRRWGNPTYEDPRIPAPFTEGPFVQVAGSATTIALRENGQVVVWALDNTGFNCGLTTPPDGLFVQVAAGVWHAAALGTDGSITTWGCTHSPWNSDNVSEAPAGSKFSYVACGYVNTHAIRVDGTLSSAGYTWDGATGCPPGSSFVKVAGGWGHGLALREDGSIAAWGRNVNGECNVPPGTFSDIAAGDPSSIALRTDGTVVAWGRCEWYASGVQWNGCLPPTLPLVTQLTIHGAQAGALVTVASSCPGDITGGGVVDGIDLAAVLGAWGTSGQGKFNADVNDDGTVDAGDLSIVLAGWGPCPN